MTRLKGAVKGDVGDYRIVQLSGVADLDTVTALQAHVWRHDDDAAKTTLTATVENSALRTIRVQLGGIGGWLATAEPYPWLIEYELTFGSTVITWPGEQPDELPVRAPGD